MGKTYIVRLYFRNALHVGASSPGIGIEGTEHQIIHSDTLWAALCNNWAIADKSLDIPFAEFLKSFVEGKPLFLISSAFPLTNSGYQFWVPKPLSVPFDFSEIPSNKPARRNLNKRQYGKDIKKIRFISLEHFREWLMFAGTRNLVEKIDNKKLSDKISDDIRPHNTLDRLSSESRIYHSGTSYFDYRKDKTGMYFLLQAEPYVKDVVERVMTIIQNTSGIGGNRSTGLGAISRMTISETDNNWDFLNASPLTNPVDESKCQTAYCILSLYHPNTIEPSYSGGQDTYQKALAYELILRKGWTGSLSVGRQVKRKTVYMFGEGSVFSEKSKGQLADLTPDKKITPQWDGVHKIYRYGYVFSVPINIFMGDYNE